MKATQLVMLALLAATGSSFATTAEPIRIELNAAETVQNKCRLSFVIENKDASGLASLKLDLVVFNREGVIDRHLITEMGPLRGSKTVVKTFELDSDCGGIGSVLINDVTTCAPAEPGTCLERLTLRSRLPKVRLFK